MHIFIQQFGLCAIRESLCLKGPHGVTTDHWSNKLLVLQKQRERGNYGREVEGGERVNAIELNVRI